MTESSNRHFEIGVSASPRLPARRHRLSAQEPRLQILDQINSLTYRAAELAPKKLERYLIYRTPVVSPCTGEVISTHNELPDLISPESHADNPRGNHVIVDFGDFHVELLIFSEAACALQQGPRVSGRSSGQGRQLREHNRAASPRARGRSGGEPRGANVIQGASSCPD